MATRSREKRERRRVSASRMAEEQRGGVSNYLKMPDGLESFKPKAGSYRLDFMAFEAGEGNPRAEEGEPYWERTFWVHRDVGANGEWHLCAAKTFKKPCPVCEERARMARDQDPDEDLIKELSPKERQLFLVRSLEDPDELLLWEISFHLFGAALRKKIRASDEEDEYQYFADPEDGKTVRVTLEQSQHGKWLETTDIEFKERKRQPGMKSVAGNPCLDDCLVATPYDILKKLFLQIDEEDEPEDKPDDKPDRKSKGGRDRKPARKKDEKPIAKEEIDKGTKVQHPDYGVCTVIRVSGDGTSLALEDEDGDRYRAVDSGEVEIIDTEDPGDEPEEKPKRKAGTKPKPKPKDDPEDGKWED